MTIASLTCAAEIAHGGLDARRDLSTIRSGVTATDGPRRPHGPERSTAFERRTGDIPNRAARLQRAQAFIDARLADSRLDAAAIASGIAVSRSVLYRLFAPAGGVAQYILTRRLDGMQAALRRPTESRSVACLAYEFGFSSESHCSRVFRAAYGTPPGRYRAEMDGVSPQPPADRPGETLAI